MNDEVPGRVRRAASRVSPCLFGLALLAFLLPFASISCATPRGYGSAGGGVTATYRGITMVTGGMPELAAPENAPAPSGPVAEDHVPPQPLLVGAAVLTTIGLGVSLWPGLAARRRAVKAAVSAAVAALCAGLGFLAFDNTMTSRIVDRITRAGPGGLADADVGAFVSPNNGFWTILALLTLAAVLNAALAASAPRRGLTETDTPLAEPPEAERLRAA